MISIFRLRLRKVFFVIFRPYFWKGILKRTFPSIEHYKTLEYIKDTKISFIFDVGANKGQFCLIANYLFPEAEIFAFEPLDAPAKTFKNLFSRNSLIKFYKLALSTKNENLKIYETNKNDSSSLLIPTKLNNEYFAVKLKKEHIVKTTSLNNWIFLNENNFEIRNALLKIDVQGFELQVLKGSDKVLQKFNYLIIELSHQILYAKQPTAKKVIDYLSHNGFNLIEIYNKAYEKSGKIIQADYLFKNENKNLN